MCESGIFFEVIIATYGDSYLSSASSYEMQYNCPYCESVRGKSDDDHKLYINSNKGVFRCFKCETKGYIDSKDIKYFRNKINNLDTILSDFIKFESSEITKYHIPSMSAVDHEVYRSYLINRGFTDDDIRFYDIRCGSSILKFYPYRVVVPNIIELSDRNRTDMLVARSIIPTEKFRYKNPPGSASKKSVFNLHRIPDNNDRICIAEGVFSSMSIGRDSVATYGKMSSIEQCKMIAKKSPKRIYIVYDFGAEDSASKLAKNLRNIALKSEIFITPLTSEADPNDLGHDEINRLIEDTSVKYNQFYDILINL